MRNFLNYSSKLNNVGRSMQISRISIRKQKISLISIKYIINVKREK
jgi:hypothetical protein